MARIKRELITILKDSGRVEQVHAEIHGPLGIYEDSLGDLWSITHIGTGCQIGPLVTRRTALRLLKPLRQTPITDAYWAEIKKPSDVRRKRFAVQRAAVKAILAEFAERGQ